MFKSASLSSTAPHMPFLTAKLVPHLIITSLLPSTFGEVSHRLQIPASLSKSITCCKFSPGSSHILVGYGVAPPPPSSAEDRVPSHPVVSFYKPVQGARRKGGGRRGGRGGGGGGGGTLEHVNTIMSSTDDVNIAAFQPDGLGIVYGTKEGRVRVISSEDRNPRAAQAL